MHMHTASRRGHCPGGGRLSTNASGTTSNAKRSAVNRNGGISRNANADVRKLVAQAMQTSSSRERSRGDMQGIWADDRNDGCRAARRYQRERQAFVGASLGRD